MIFSKLSATQEAVRSTEICNNTCCSVFPSFPSSFVHTSVAFSFLSPALSLSCETTARAVNSKWTHDTTCCACSSLFQVAAHHTCAISSALSPFSSQCLLLLSQAWTKRLWWNSGSRICNVKCKRIRTTSKWRNANKGCKN